MQRPVMIPMQKFLKAGLYPGRRGDYVIIQLDTTEVT